MERVKTQVLKQPWDVDRRLSEIGLNRERLLTARGVAINQAANATPHHCANASGTFAYQHGTWALRNQYVGEKWKVDRTNGVEAIINISLGIRVVFSNVTIACDDENEPKPRSAKGAGAERLCMGNLFEDLPRYVRRQDEKIATYYLMVDEKGAVELTRPVISGGTFSEYVERIYLSDGNDLTSERLSLDDDDAVTDFDPQVVRKN